MLRPLAWLGLSLTLAFPSAAEEIQWQTLPLVGVAEFRDGKPADGVVYEVQRFIERELPEYQHSYNASAPRRLYHELEAGRARCSTILLQDALLDRVGYFAPFVPALPMQLIVRDGMQEKLPLEQGALSLEKLLRQPHLRGAITTSRGYPPQLQALLAQGIAQGSIQSMESNSSGQNLLSMISLGRLDYTLEFPIVVKRHAQTSLLTAPLQAIPVTEDRSLSTAGFYCARTPWGLKIATRLDRAIRIITASPDQLMPLYRATNDPATAAYFEPRVRAWLQRRSQTPAAF